MTEENHEKTPVRLVDTGIRTRDLPNERLVRYHGATSLGKTQLKPHNTILLNSISFLREFDFRRAMNFNRLSIDRFLHEEINRSSVGGSYSILLFSSLPTFNFNRLHLAESCRFSLEDSPSPISNADEYKD